MKGVVSYCSFFSFLMIEEQEKGRREFLKLCLLKGVHSFIRSFSTGAPTAPPPGPRGGWGLGAWGKVDIRAAALSLVKNSATGWAGAPALGGCSYGPWPCPPSVRRG